MCTLNRTYSAIFFTTSQKLYDVRKQARFGFDKNLCAHVVTNQTDPAYIIIFKRQICFRFTVLDGMRLLWDFHVVDINRATLLLILHASDRDLHMPFDIM